MPAHPPLKVALCGDTHGNTDWVAALCATAAAADCSYVVVLGDFGYWVHKADGRAYIADVNAVAATAGLEVVFVDGNHEYHSTHPAKPPHRRLGLAELTPGPDGFVQIADRIRYAPRGHRWTWADVRFGALGGAASSDVGRRKRFRDFWVEETLTVADVARLGTDPLDVLLTHDAPGEYLIGERTDGREDDRRTVANRAHLTAAVRATRPRLVAHGHWHTRYSATVELGDVAVRVEGLGADCDPDGEQLPLTAMVDAIVVLELPSLALTTVDDLASGT